MALARHPARLGRRQPRLARGRCRRHRRRLDPGCPLRCLARDRHPPPRRRPRGASAGRVAAHPPVVAGTTAADRIPVLPGRDSAATGHGPPPRAACGCARWSAGSGPGCLPCSNEAPRCPAAAGCQAIEMFQRKIVPARQRCLAADAVPPGRPYPGGTVWTASVVLTAGTVLTTRNVLIAGTYLSAAAPEEQVLTPRSGRPCGGAAKHGEG